MNLDHSHLLALCKSEFASIRHAGRPEGLWLTLHDRVSIDSRTDFEHPPLNAWFIQPDFQRSDLQAYLRFYAVQISSLEPNLPPVHNRLWSKELHEIALVRVAPTTFEGNQCYLIHWIWGGLQGKLSLYDAHSLKELKVLGIS